LAYVSLLNRAFRHIHPVGRQTTSWAFTVISPEMSENAGYPQYTPLIIKRTTRNEC